MEELKDIKEIVEVHEYSLETLLGLVALTVLLGLVVFYLYKNRRKRRKRLTPREIALSTLKNLDYDDTKAVVYHFVLDGELCVDDKNRDAFRAIEKTLVPYKYKKDVPALDRELKEKIQTFIRGLK